MNISTSSSRALRAAVLLIAAFVLLGCNLLSKGASTVENQAGTTPVSASGGQAAAPSAPAQADVALQSGLPRGFRYAGLDFELQKAVITTQPPEGANTDDQRGAYAQTVWKISNPTTDTTRIQNGVFTLKLGGATYTRGYDDAFNPQDTKDLSLVFSVPAGLSWSGASISFAEPNKIPAELALEGDEPKDAYPKKLAGSGGQAQVKVPALLYELTEASIDLDGFGQRADTGTHYLLLSVTVTCKDKYPCYVGPESFRALADGTPYAALTIDPISAAIDPDTNKTFRLAVQIPEQAKEAELQVGEAGKDQATIPINLAMGQ